jgi:hypothetical protein
MRDVSIMVGGLLLSAALLAALLISACASSPRDVPTRFLPREDGTISAISVAGEADVAATANVEKANRYCEAQGGRAVFSAEETKYQGIPTKQGETISKVYKRIPGAPGDLTSDEDYRVTTEFKCLPPAA